MCSKITRPSRCSLTKWLCTFHIRGPWQTPLGDSWYPETMRSSEEFCSCKKKESSKLTYLKMEFICRIFSVRDLFNTTFNYKNSQLGSHHITGEENDAWSDPGNWTHISLTPSPHDATPAARTWVCACTGSSSSSSLLTLIVWRLLTRPA